MGVSSIVKQFNYDFMKKNKESINVLDQEVETYYISDDIDKSIITDLRFDTLMTQTPTVENKQHTKGSRRMFENPFLEKLTHTHIAIPLIFFSMYAIALLYWSYDHQYLSFIYTALVFLSGVLLFTLVEYLMHRYLFHLPPTSKFNEKVAYKIHGIHHDYPKDKDRLAMPPILSIILSTLFLLLFKAIMGNAGLAFTAGFVVGYAAYLSIHFIIHAYIVPKNVFKVLWIHHSIHHYKKTDKAFGVSSPLWDYVFRTMP